MCRRNGESKNNKGPVDGRSTANASYILFHMSFSFKRDPYPPIPLSRHLFPLWTRTNRYNRPRRLISALIFCYTFPGIVSGLLLHASCLRAVFMFLLSSPSLSSRFLSSHPYILAGYFLFLTSPSSIFLPSNSPPVRPGADRASVSFFGIVTT